MIAYGPYIYYQPEHMCHFLIMPEELIKILKLLPFLFFKKQVYQAPTKTGMHNLNLSFDIILT